ncbi:MAG: T9SS type A sorting domain-containing protein [Agriterribacter sp.]
MKVISTLFAILTFYASIAQVSLVKNVHIGSPLYPINGKLLFAGLDINNNYQLWVSDGTETGTIQLKSFTNGSMYEADEGADNPYRYAPIVFNNELYFFAFVGQVGHGIDLWKSDGTAAGTVDLGTFTNHFSGLNFHSGTISFCVFNNALYFSCGDNLLGASLWKTDGGTPTKVIDVSSGGNIWGPMYMTVFNNAMYFTASDGIHGVEVWKSDGTAAGTHMLKDIFPGANGVENYNADFTVIKPQFTVSGNYLYFTGYRNEDFNFYNLYRTDGTEAGTIRLDSTIYVQNITSSLQPYQADANGVLLFTGYPNGLNVNTSGLFKSDGTIAGTTEVITNNHLAAYGIFTGFKNKTFFSGTQGTGSSQQYGLCASDGTTTGTSMVYTFPAGSSASYTLSFLNTGTNLFFRALVNMPASSNYRIVQTDGTSAGTKIFYGADAWGPASLYNGHIYFLGSDSISGDFGLYKFLPAPDNALPVTLTSFTVSLNQQQQPQLRWQTAVEKNSKGFDIERSMDDITFHTIAFVASSGESSALKNYSFEDNQPVEGVNYYRLKQTDIDGTYTYSEVRSINIHRENNHFSIVPNPSTGHFILVQHPLSGSILQVSMADMNGRILLKKEFVAGTNPISLDVNSVPQGIYIITLIQNGNIMFTGKLVKL